MVLQAGGQGVRGWSRYSVTPGEGLAAGAGAHTHLIPHALWPSTSWDWGRLQGFCNTQEAAGRGGLGFPPGECE